MHRHVIDKFGHALAHPQPMEVDDRGDRSAVRVVSRDYLENHYISKVEHERLLTNLAQELRAYVDNVVKSCLQLASDRTSWDGRNLRITNVAEGDANTDVSTVKQTCTYDSSVMNFKCGNRYFNLVENSANEQVVCFTTNLKGDQIFAAYGGDRQEVIPTSALKWDMAKQAVTDSKDKQLVWNEVNKKFQYLEDLDINPVMIEKVKSGAESVWDGRSLRLTKLAEGSDPNDACIMKQVLVYDEDKKLFKCGSKEFDLVINNPDNPLVVVTGRPQWPELRIYGTNEEARYVTMMRWDFRKGAYTKGHHITDWKGRKIQWDEERKVFNLVEEQT